MQGKPLDKVDRQLLRALQNNARLSNTALANLVGLSQTPCADRVRHLEDQGYIQGYHARISPEKLGLELLVFVEISLLRTAPDVFAEFREAVLQLPQLIECHLVSGNFDYLLKARVADMNAYRKLLGETILLLPGVSDSRTYVVMEEIKESQLTIPA